MKINFMKKFSSTILRGKFKKLESEDLNYFKTILSSDSIQTEDLDKYNFDWLKKYEGKSQLALKPKTTEEISSILKYCDGNKLAVVPQGGNTGLVGGSVPVHDEIIISLERMNKIINFDAITSTLHCEAGCILESLNIYLEDRGFTMPLDLGAKGSCQIGGNIATNAGGIHFVKHGSMRKNTKGIKAVLADGTIIDTLNALPKNNTGYDLKQLFIGSEGTLGVITECLINIPTKLKFNDVSLIACEKFSDILDIYQKVKKEFENELSAIEFFDNQALLVQEKHGRKSPFTSKYPFYMIIEIASNLDYNKQMLEDLLTKLEPVDGIIAENRIQKRSIWELRETIQEGAAKEGLVLSYDISLPLEHFYEIVEESRKRVGDLANVIGYGHIGDYNLHLNIINKNHKQDENFLKLVDIMEPFVYDFLVKYKGSVSAEHGIGVHKTKYLNRSQTNESISLMKLIKNTMDPNAILNPYKVL